MGSICILTDSTVQYATAAFNGQQAVRVIPIQACLSQQVYQEDQFKIKTLPVNANNQLQPHLIPPSAERLRQCFNELHQKHDRVVAVFSSSHLSSCFHNAQKAISTGDKARVQIIDSQTISFGLGFLVQKAAEAIEAGESATEVERLVCSLIPHIYAVFCTPGLNYLYYNGFLDASQAVVGEMLNLLSAYGLEEGRLTPLEKLRNQRQTTDFFEEFLDEFDNLQHVALIQSYPPHSQVTRLVRDRMKSDFPDILFTEQKLNLALATLFGPRGIGLVAVETHHHKSR